MTVPTPLRPTRRGALTGALLVLATTGCDAIAPAPADPDGAPPSSPQAVPDADPDPDGALVAEVRAALVDASVLVTSTLRARPGLTAELGPFERLHARHLEALENDRPRGRTPVRGDAATARSRVRVREARLQTTLADASVVARSGPLAALLASMSAAVAQQLTAPVGDA